LFAGSEGSRESEEGANGIRTNNSHHHHSERACSEDEFAEDELSLAGDVAPPVVAPTPPPASTMPSRRHHVHQHHEAPTSGTSSLQGSTGNDLCRDLDSSDADDRGKHSETDSFLAMRMNLNNRNMSLPPGRRSREPPPPPPHGHGQRTSERRPKSLDRRSRAWRNSPRNRSNRPSSPPPPAGLEPAAFHEGLILDALGGFPRGLMFPGGRNSRGSQQRSPPLQPPAYHLPYSHVMSRHVNPYESVSVLGLDPPPRPELTSFRPHPKNSSSQDSFNSDSGFSNHTSGGRATSGGGSSRGRHGELYDSIQRPLPPLLS
jgi:hypothetical protein